MPLESVTIGPVVVRPGAVRLGVRGGPRSSSSDDSGGGDGDVTGSAGAEGPGCGSKLHAVAVASRGERRVVTSNACHGTRDRNDALSEPPDAPAPLELTRDLGWLLAMVSALGALVGGSWLHFPQDSVGMWAGYWVTGCSTVAILGCIFLRTSQPMALGIAVTAVPGAVLLLLGAAARLPDEHQRDHDRRRRRHRHRRPHAGGRSPACTYLTASAQGDRDRSADTALTRVRGPGVAPWRTDRPGGGSYYEGVRLLRGWLRGRGVVAARFPSREGVEVQILASAPCPRPRDRAAVSFHRAGLTGGSVSRARARARRIRDVDHGFEQERLQRPAGLCLASDDEPSGRVTSTRRPRGPPGCTTTPGVSPSRSVSSGSSTRRTASQRRSGLKILPTEVRGIASRT